MSMRDQAHRPRRHCMVVHAHYPARETRVQREASVLVDRGFAVDVVCLRGPGEPSRSVHDGVTVYRVPIRRHRERGFSTQLLEYLTFFLLAGAVLTALHVRRRYASVQVHNLPDFLVFAAMVPKLTGARIFLDLHDLMPEFFASRTGAGMDNPFVRLLQRQERMSCRFADHVITVTDGWRDTLIRRGVSPEKVSVVMNVADSSIFRPADDHPADTSSDGFFLLYHGTLAHRYGVDLVLDAVAQVRGDIPGLKVRLLGNGDFYEELVAKRAALALENCVEISNAVVGIAELAALVRSADVGVVPNRRDVFTDGILPTKLMEYVASGIPVVAARTPAIESYFDDAMIQFFEPGSAADLAAAVRALAAARPRRLALAENADAFNRKYGWEKVAASYAGLVDTVAPALGGAGAPDRLVPATRSASVTALRTTHRPATYTFRTSVAPVDPDWDDFLARTPGGHHTQTSLWARVKESMGWSPLRIVAEQDGHLVGGAQVLYRRLRGVGAVGYVARGPVLAADDRELGVLLVDQMEKAARELRIRHLTVQPPGIGESLPSYLANRAYLPAAAEIAPQATAIVDVARDPDRILASMSSKTRYNIRVSGRKSVTVREGSVEDLDTYYALLEATAERQGFTPLPKSHYLRLWRVLAPGGHVRLSLAELEGEALSGQIAIAFGDTVVNKMSVWSGRAGNRRPNEALQWSAIQWAHEQGYRYYDLEGMKLKAARALVRGEPLPESVGQTVTSFKLGFGGEVVLMPGAHVYIPNRALRWGFAELYPRVSDMRSVRKAVKSIRTSSGANKQEIGV